MVSKLCSNSKYAKNTGRPKPAISKVIAPKVLFWFRWAAVATILTGFIVAYLNGYLHQAITWYWKWKWKKYGYRYRYVARNNHGLQCLVYNLA